MSKHMSKAEGAKLGIVITRRPEVGDWADHKSGDLDPGRVVEVNEAKSMVRISILGTSSTWLPASNYTFTPGL